MMKTVFIRAIEAPVDEKAAAVRAAIQTPGPARFEVAPSIFSAIPKSPFAYWLSNTAANCFRNLPPLLSEGREARQGASSTSAIRYLRLWTEPSAESIATRFDEAKNGRACWVPFAKGGQFARFHSDIHLLMKWDEDGAEVKEEIARWRERKGWGYSWSATLNGYSNYGRPGLTWTSRTQAGLSLRALNEGCIFADKGPAIFVENEDFRQLLALLAVCNSEPFRALVALQMAFGSFEVGVIQRTPVPRLDTRETTRLGKLARRSWSLTRTLDMRAENSHAFVMPALLQTEAESLTGRAHAWALITAEISEKIETLARDIDDHVYILYGISNEERQRIEQGFDGIGESVEEMDDDTDDEEAAEVDASPMVASLLSWTIGVAFGRFDVLLATGKRTAPPEPEPFDPLPVCSPGMLTGEDGLPLDAPLADYPLAFPSDGILVDDPGHPRDVVRAVRQVFDAIFDDANARWHEAVELLGTADLRTWFARDFFEPHIKRYSKSRRKAPIYWQLATASGSYSVWIYIHRATRDTLFRVVNDFVGPKLDHEKAKLNGLTQEAGSNPSAAQRREIEQQETFAGELQSLRAEVGRVAPLWAPNLDDGVILNFAPLWRLVPQSRSWQSECKKAWNKLQSGDYDWAHLAMHLWPERVVPKCIDDRSLAIAHGLEDVFWHEDDSGAWRKHRVDETTVHRLIVERTSSTVKAALKDLLSAPTPTAGKGSRARGRGATPSRQVPQPVAGSQGEKG